MKNRFGIDWSNTPGKLFAKGPHLSRRMFFHNTATAVGGYFLMPVRPMETIARAAATPINKAKNCIYIFMAGGPSHTDTFDLKEGPWTPAYMNPTSYGDIRFPQGIMPKIADQMGSIALVRSITSWAAAHGLMQTWYQIGRNPVSGLSRIAPHIGSVVSLELSSQSANQTLPAFFSLNTGGGPAGGYFPPEYGPFFLSPNGGGLGNTLHPGGQPVFDRRYGLLTDIDFHNRDTGGDWGPAPAEMVQFNLNARKLMYNPDVDKIFNFDQTERNRFGNTSFGNACITARNLLRAKMGTRFIQITVGSWDHHTNIYANNGPLMSLSSQFDKGLGQLIVDLRNDGALDDTLIVAMGEFGRTVGPVTQNAGRDHLQQQAALFCGGGVTGGRVIGQTDSTGSKIADPGWSRNREIRAEDLEATIYSALGIDWTTVRQDDPFKRGFEYVPQSPQDLYGPVHELWS